MSGTDEGYQDLKKRTATSVIWSVARVLWSTGASFVIFVVLARILGPEDFGLFALASLFVEISRIIATAGLGSAVIRLPELSEEMADTAFWANVGLSFVVALVVMGLAPLYGTLVENAAVVDILRALAFTLPVSALAGIHGARLTRDYKHKLFAMQTAISSVVSGLAGIVAALNGFGVWSLVVQAWVAAVLGIGMAWFALPWLPKLRFSIPDFKSIIGFSLSMTFNQVLWILMGRISDIFISRAFGAAELGKYRIAWRVYELIGQIAMSPLGSVAMLTFSKLQTDLEKLRAAYYRILSTAALVAFPMLIGFAVLSDEVIRVVFSDKWEGAGDIARVLALMSVIFVFNYISPGVMAALNKSGQITKVAIVQVLGTLILTWLSLPFGLMAVAAAYVLRAHLTFPYQQYLLGKGTGITFAGAGKAIAAPLAAALVMAVGVWGLKSVISNYIGNDIATIAICVVVGAILYGLNMLLFGRSALEPIFSMIRPKINSLLKRA